MRGSLFHYHQSHLVVCLLALVLDLCLAVVVETCLSDEQSSYPKLGVVLEWRNFHFRCRTVVVVYCMRKQKFFKNSKRFRGQFKVLTMMLFS